MRTYFNINGEYRIDYGTDYAILYRFSKNEQYVFDKLHMNVFELIEKQKNYYEICIQIGEDKVKNVISEFNKIQLIKKSSVPQGREIARVGKLYNSAKYQMLKLRHLFINLPFACQENCKFCTSKSVLGCFSCIGSKNSWNDDYTITLKKAIEFANNQRCNTIILKGGNPFLLSDIIEKLLSVIRKLYSGKIILIVPSELNIKQKEILKHYDVNVCINLEFNKFKKNLLNGEIDSRNLYNINIDINQIEEINDIRGLHSGLFLTIYSSSNITIDHSLLMNFQRPIISKEMYSYAQQFHPCMNGGAAIDLHGNILPCPSFNSNELTNYANLNDEYIDISYLANYWTKAQKKFKKCNKCENRSYCFDCRAYEESDCDSDKNSILSCIREV